jgi:hypothetical protein
MPSPFVSYTKDKALKFVANNMAFTGDLLDWISGEIGADNSETYVAQLAPIKLNRKIIGPLKRKTRLKFILRSASDGCRLRFMDIDSKPVDKPNTPDDKSRKPSSEWRRKRRLDELGEAGIALVVEPSTRVSGEVNLTVKAGVNGTIINVPALPRTITGKQIFIWHCRVIDPADMVGWYDPLQLMRTGVEVFFSTLFGRHSDYRLMEALTPVSQDDPGPHTPYYDFTVHWKKDETDESLCDTYDPEGPSRKEIWLDYVGDVGDGWNSTYAVAYSLVQPQLNLKYPKDAQQKVYSTKRGAVLIFGGDQVYPIANRLNYKQRLLGPYETAFETRDHPHPHAFAIPGNHDWYDSLVSFTRLFCQKRFFAGWQTDQSRSYFALKLPGGWWLLGTDVQLDSDIDVPQVNYFKEVAKSIQAGDRIIICTAEPHWVYAKLYRKTDANYNENNLAFFEKKIIPENARVVAFIAGDQHHYRRYQAKDCTQKITAGGGGAFMHPTHGEKNIETLSGGFTRQESFPSKSKSRFLSMRNILFLFYNFKFGLLTGILYLLTAWSVMADVSNAKGFNDAADKVLDQMATSPAPVFWVVALFLGFVLFTDTHSKLYRWIAGPVHGAAHVLAVFYIGWAATWYTVGPQSPFKSFRQLALAGVIIFVGGWLVGPIILGLYLFISLAVGRHANEAFSAIKIENWKNFLRLRIDSDRNLTIFPVGIRKVPRMRNWRRRADGQKGPGMVLDAQYAVSTILIEQPLVFIPVNDGKGSVTMGDSKETC